MGKALPHLHHEHGIFSASDASDIDGIAFQGYNNWGNTPGSGFIFDRVAIRTPVVDTDGDGVNDDQDDFINSNTDPTVVIDGCDSGVGNQVLPNGATFNDLIAEAAVGAKNHGAFVSAVAKLTNEWKKAGLISGKEKGKIMSCA